MRIQSHAASWRAFRAIQRNTLSLRDFVVAELYREAVGLTAARDLKI